MEEVTRPVLYVRAISTSFNGNQMNPNLPRTFTNYPTSTNVRSEDNTRRVTMGQKLKATSYGSGSDEAAG